MTAAAAAESAKRVNAFVVPTIPHIFFQPLSPLLASLGSAKGEDSVNSRQWCYEQDQQYHISRRELIRSS